MAKTLNFLWFFKRSIINMIEVATWLIVANKCNPLGMVTW